MVKYQTITKKGITYQVNRDGTKICNLVRCPDLEFYLNHATTIKSFEKKPWNNFIFKEDYIQFLVGNLILENINQLEGNANELLKRDWKYLVNNRFSDWHLFSQNDKRLLVCDFPHGLDGLAVELSKSFSNAEIGDNFNLILFAPRKKTKMNLPYAMVYSARNKNK